MKINNIILAAVFIFSLLFSNNVYSQAPLMLQPSVELTMPCKENPGLAYEKEVDFSGLKLKLILLNDSKCYMFKKKGFYLDASHVARLQIKTASSISDCERWVTEERNLCEDRVAGIEEAYKTLVNNLGDKNKDLLEKNKNLNFELEQNKKDWTLSYSNIGIGLAVGIVSSIIVVSVTN